MGKELVPSKMLNVEYTQLQQTLINPKPVDYAMREIARHAHGTSAKQAMARRKLDNIGYVRGDSGFANDPDRILRINNQLKLMESVAAISKETSNAKAAETSLENLKLIEAAPAALAKLRRRMGMSASSPCRRCALSR